MEQSSSPGDLTRPRLITGERDILARIRVFPVNIRSSSVKRNVQEMDYPHLLKVSFLAYVISLNDI